MIEGVSVIISHCGISSDKVPLMLDSHFARKLHFHLHTQDCEMKLITISLRIDHNIYIKVTN